MQSLVSCRNWEVSALILTCPTRRSVLTQSTALTPCWKPSRKLERMLPTLGRSLLSVLASCEELGTQTLLQQKDVLTVCVSPSLLCHPTFARCQKAEGWREETAGPRPLEVERSGGGGLCCF